MKKLFLILPFLVYLNSSFASENLLNRDEEKLPSPLKLQADTPLSSLPAIPNSYSYFIVGSGVLIQQIGIGRRYKNFEILKGHDVSLNAHFSLPLLLSTNDSRSLYLPFPSIKYSSLKYKDSTPTSEYYGIALECGFTKAWWKKDVFGKPHGRSV